MPPSIQRIIIYTKKTRELAEFYVRLLDLRGHQRRQFEHDEFSMVSDYAPSSSAARYFRSIDVTDIVRIYRPFSSR